MVSFKDAIVDFFKRYFKFKGDSTRAEYWWVQLAEFIVMLILGLIIVIGVAIDSEPLMWTAGIITFLVGLAIIIPSLALTFRRYQDCGLTVNGALIVWVIIVILGLFAGQNAFMGTLSSFASLVAYLMLILPSGFLKGKLGSLSKSDDE